jgi:hypothetical protein
MARTKTAAARERRDRILMKYVYTRFGVAQQEQFKKCRVLFRP